jgi:hypothetical protein
MGVMIWVLFCFQLTEKIAAGMETRLCAVITQFPGFSTARANMPPPQGLKGVILRFLGFRFSTNIPPPQGLKGIILRFFWVPVFYQHAAPNRGLKVLF